MSQAHEMRVLLADNQAGATNAISLAARNCDLVGEVQHGRDPGKRGTRQQSSCGARVLRETVSGGFDFYPTTDQLDWILQRLIGDRISSFPTTALIPAETLPAFYGYVDKVGEIYRYDSLHFASMVLTCNEGDYVNCRLDFVGKDETSGVSWPGTPPAIDCDTEYVTADVGLVYNAVSCPFKSLTLSIDNGFGDHLENATKRTRFEAGELAISVDGQFAHRSDTPDLAAIFDRPSVAGYAGTITLDDGTTSYAFAFPNMKTPGGRPIVPDSGEILQTVQAMCYRTTSTAQITVTKT